jgi:hypothetical protein
MRLFSVAILVVMYADVIAFLAAPASLPVVTPQPRLAGKFIVLNICFTEKFALLRRKYWITCY